MGKRIMLVDDSRVVYIQMKQILQNSGYEIAEYCGSGEEALEKYSSVQPDLVTMDIIMPGMDGLETARILIEEHPEAKIVMLSSLAYDDTFHEAETIGARAFTAKPLNPDELLSTLARVLAE